jgi:tetratricopeptide (TPR) repeat protein
LAIKERVKGKDTSTAQRLSTTASVSVYDNKEDDEQALLHYQRSLAIYERVKGKDHIDCASTLHEIGFVYSNKGDYEQALLHYQRSLAIKERVKGKDHIHCASTLDGIGSI